MAWGGASGGFGGPSAVSSSAAAGLPFAGVPPELADRVEAILETEPEHPTRTSRSPRSRRRRRRSRCAGSSRPASPRWPAAFALVLVETLTMQAGPLLTQRAIDKGILAKSTQVLVVTAVLYAISVIISMIASGFRVAWTGKVGEALLYDLRVRVFAHLQRLSMDFFTGEKAGRVMTRMTSDIEALSQLFQDGIVNLAVQALTMVIVTIILFLLNPALAAITVLLVVPTMTIATVWFRKASDRGYTRVRERIAEVLADLQESLSGIRIISAHNRRRHNVQQHRNIVGEYRDANQYTARVERGLRPGDRADRGRRPGRHLAGRRQHGAERNAHDRSAHRVRALPRSLLRPDPAARAALHDLPVGSGRGRQAAASSSRPSRACPSGPTPSTCPRSPAHVVLDHVSFGYTTGQAVLHDVTLDIAPGETFALVGATGAGKSTIAKLVTRFYDPTEGTVSIDGLDLREVTLESLRRQLGVVPQEAFLFAGSVRSNVTFARPDATDEEVDEACRAVGLDELIDRLPEGLDTLVHERGATLSSGERQLLALTRAFLARPRVLVLDEATANLDLRSEAQVEHGLDALLEGRTAILIAHRLATAMRADRIAVVDDGEVIELGSHAELLAQRGQYAAMFETWQRHMSGGGSSTNGTTATATSQRRTGTGTAARTVADPPTDRRLRWRPWRHERETDARCSSRCCAPRACGTSSATPAAPSCRSSTRWPGRAAQTSTTSSPCRRRPRSRWPTATRSRLAAPRS